MLLALNPVGSLSPPASMPPAIDPLTGNLIGVLLLINTVLRIIFIVAGIYAFFNIVIAGISFISAGGDPKKVTAAWEKIWQSFLGLVILVSSFIIAAVIGIIIFRDPSAILNPRLPPP